VTGIFALNGVLPSLWRPAIERAVLVGIAGALGGPLPVVIAFLDRSL
jgi:hypothetical protein